jgi:DNA-binding SARP family transcriptional activator
VLALLALHHPAGVGAARIADGLWGPRPPAHAGNAVQVHVSRLRRLGLGVERSGPQYRLTGEVRVDAAELAELLADGEERLRAGRPEEAAERLSAALGLVRGRPLAGLEDLPFAAVEIARLEGLVAAARRARVEADVQLGRYAAALPEVAALAAERPDDEGLLALQMRALHGAGRHGEALAAYDRGRRRLEAEHGITPSPQLRDLHRAMLAQTHTEAPPVAHPPPRQVPHGPAVFVGRAAEVAELRALLAPDGRARSAPVAAVDGPGGVGKTALAVHVADLLAPAFPDGVLFAALGGAEPDRAPTAAVVLGRFLGALGVPAADVPADVEAAAARYRTELAGRRVLVVLDDAVDARQVRPLLPTGGGCAALVTSRAPLALAEAVPVALGMLPLTEAGELLRRVGRTTAGGPDAAALEAVARACGRLPLALHIAGGRMANRPAGFAARLAELLSDETRRLGELRLGDLDVRAGFAVSHRLLSAAEQRAFARLARWPGPTVPLDLAAALLGDPDVAEVLGRLVTVRLLDEVEPGRYRFHDLLRLFGRELAREAAPVDGAEQEAALLRALRHLLDAATAADAALGAGPAPAPGEPDRRPGARAAALAWFEAELPNLVAAAALAADRDDPEGASVAWRLADTAFRYLDFAKRRAEWTQLGEHGVRAARRVGDARGEATALNRLGCAHRELGRLDEARRCLLRALELAGAGGDVGLQLSVLNQLAITAQDAGQVDEALARHAENLALARRAGDRYTTAVALNNLGDVHLQRGDHDRARDMFTEAGAILAELGDLRALGMTLHNLGELALHQGRHADAAELYASGAQRSREAGDRYSRAAGLVGLGHARRALGEAAAARAAWREAHAILVDIDPAEADAVADALAELLDSRAEQAIQP